MIFIIFLRSFSGNNSVRGKKSRQRTEQDCFFAGFPFFYLTTSEEPGLLWRALLSHSSLKAQLILPVSQKHRAGDKKIATGPRPGTQTKKNSSVVRKPSSWLETNMQDHQNVRNGTHFARCGQD